MGLMTYINPIYGKEVKPTPVLLHLSDHVYGNLLLKTIQILCTVNLGFEMAYHKKILKLSFECSKMIFNEETGTA